MWVRAFGRDYYLNEKSFAEQMAQPAPNWRMEEIVAIQHQMREAEDRLLDYLKQTATSDPLETLRKHIDDMVGQGK